MKTPRHPAPPEEPSSVVVVVSKRKGSALPALFVVALLAGATWWISGRDPEVQVLAKATTTQPASVPGVSKETTGNLPAIPALPAKSDEIFEPFGSTTPPAGPFGRTSPTFFEPPPPVPPPAPPEAAKPSAPLDVANAKLLEEDPLMLVGLEATKPMVVARDRELLDYAVSHGAWEGYRKLLGFSIAAALKPFREAEGKAAFDMVWKEPALYQAFLRWQLLDRFPTQIPDHEDSKALFGWLMTEDAAMEEVMISLKTGDDREKVVVLLTEMRVPDKERFAKYFNLALACALVFDETITVSPKIHPTSETSPEVEPLERFVWYVGKDQKGKLAAPVSRMGTRDLVWVVCAPVPTSELEWAVGKMHLDRRNWGNAYGMVEYLMERAVNGLDPYEGYTFSEILGKGGICGDQSYFCVNTARALGIPAITLSGETDLGGHAWAAVKVKDDEWNTNIGRIGGAANGKGSNPQVGGSVTEQEVWLWNERGQQNRPTVVNVFRLLRLADFFGSMDMAPRAEAAITAAHLAGREFPETWQRVYGQLVEKSKAPGTPGGGAQVDTWIRFIADMRAEFRENPRMAELASKAESEFVFPFVPENDSRRALARDRRRIGRNGGEQADLIADSLKREADLIASQNAPDSRKRIGSLYSRALREYGGSITGFKHMAEDYFSLVNTDAESARDAAREIELAFTRVVETGSKDWFRANTETGIYKMICSYYRTAGEPAKAEKLEKRYMRLLRDAERGAL